MGHKPFDFRQVLDNQKALEAEEPPKKYHHNFDDQPSVQVREFVNSLPFIHTLLAYLTLAVFD